MGDSGLGDVCASEKVSGRAEVSRAACRLQHVSSPGSDAWSMRGGRSGLARLREEGGHSAVGKWRGVLVQAGGGGSQGPRRGSQRRSQGGAPDAGHSASTRARACLPR